MDDIPLSFDAGLYLTKFETKLLNRNLDNKKSNTEKISKELIPQIYVDKDGKLSCEIKIDKKNQN